MFNLQQKKYKLLLGFVFLTFCTFFVITKAEGEPEATHNSEQAAFLAAQDDSPVASVQQPSPKAQQALRLTPEKAPTTNSSVSAENLGDELTEDVEEEEEIKPKKKFANSKTVVKTINNMIEDDSEEALLKKQSELLAEVQRLQNNNDALNARKNQLENDPHFKTVEGTILSINDFAVVLTVSTLAFVAICAAIGWKIKDLSVRANSAQLGRVASKSIPKLSELTNALLDSDDDDEDNPTSKEAVKQISGLIATYKDSLKKRGDRDEKFSDLSAFNQGLTLVISREIQAEKAYLGGDSGIIFKNSVSSPKLTILNEMLEEVKKFGTPLGHSADRDDYIDKIARNSTKTKSAKEAWKNRVNDEDDEKNDEDTMAQAQVRRNSGRFIRSSSFVSDSGDYDSGYANESSSRTRQTRPRRTRGY